MKPAWDKLMGEYAEHKTILVADVDCTAEGKDLCEKHGVQGFPTIKWGDPTALEDYKGKRDFDELKKFADENLKPVCSIFNKDLCDAEKLKQMEEYEALDESALDTQIAEKEAAIKTAEAEFEEGVKGLQKTFEELNKAKEEKIQKVQDAGLKVMKQVAGTRPQPEDQYDDEFLLNRGDFNDADKDKDGKVSKDEFAAFATEVVPELLPEGTFPYVKKWDTDGSKDINATEFAAGSETGGSGEAEKIEWVKQKLWSQLEASDADKDGMVTFEELKASGHGEESEEENSEEKPEEGSEKKPEEGSEKTEEEL